MSDILNCQAKFISRYNFIKYYIYTYKNSPCQASICKNTGCF